MDNTGKDATKKQVFAFGLTGLLIFGTAAGLALARGSAWGLPFFGSLAAIMGLIAVMPGPMLPLYRLWMTIALLAGQVVNSIILTVLYFFLITPFAFLRRLLRPKKPLLPYGPDSKTQSYWRPRQNPAQEKSRFTRRY
ncbi:MAG: hypothetical protein QMD09_10590 [Desulfatibacillaceae bacterium]|nr:hypothetical protein [Desulfatibacillaceae bacterium]